MSKSDARPVSRKDLPRRWTEKLSAIGLGCLAASAGLTIPAVAQNGVFLDEIVVTSRKREESLQRVPVSVSAIDSATIDRTFADSIQNLEGLSPNVIIDTFNAFPNSASISIRGISHTEIEKSFDPAIGVVVDGVFLNSNAQALIDNFDLERVEILRGPQGTLFGKNTIGGTINVVRKRPGDEYGGKISYGFSSFERHDVKGVVDLPLHEKAAFRIAASYANSDGHQTNTATGNKIGGVDTASVRVAALFRPTDDLEAYLNFDYIRDRPDIFGLRNANLPTQFFSIPMLGGAVPTFPGYPADTGPLDEFRTDLEDTDTEYDTRGISLELNWSPGDFTITSISAYRWVDEDVFSDFDAEAVAAFNSRREQEHNQFSQELRFTSEWSDRYDFVAGLYYFWNDYELNQTIDILTDFLSCGALPGAFASFGCANVGGAAQTTNSYAVFAQGNAHITDELRVTVGGRYTYEEKDFFSSPIVFPRGALGTASDSDSWSNFTPRVGLDYQVTDSVFAYASFAKGFKSGGYNGRAGTVTSIGPYDDESITTYEAGLKTEWFENRLRLNVAGFYNKYDDLQVELVRAVSGGTGQETVVTNAASAKTYGFEGEFVALVIEYLTLSGTLGVLEAKYDDFMADIGLGGVTDNSGLELRKAPGLQYSIGASFAQPVGNLGTVLADVRWSWSDDLETTTQNLAIGKRESVGNLTAALTYQSPDEAWSLSVFGRNLTDEEYVMDALSAGSTLAFQSISLPRVIGGKVEVSF